MTDPAKSVIERLRELEAKATAAPWTPSHRGGEEDAAHEGSFLGWEIDELDAPGRGQFVRGYDAHLVATTRNVLPALLSVAEAAEKVRDTVSCDCLDYAPWHNGNCPIKIARDELDAALRSLHLPA